MERRLLYHYTDKKGLLGILRSNCIWATYYKNTNDLSELTHAKELILSNIRGKYNSKLYKAFERCCNYLLNPENSLPFIFSLCHDGDALGQWRAYGKYSIGFDRDVIYQLMKRELNPSGLVKVRYCSCVTSALEKQIKKTVALFEENIHDFTLFDKKFEPNFLQLFFKLKNADFRDEHEYRLVSLVMRTDDSKDSSKYRFRNGENLRYCEILHGIQTAVREIVIGPPLHSAMERKIEIESVIKDKGMNVPVLVSRSPYRC